MMSQTGIYTSLKDNEIGVRGVQRSVFGGAIAPTLIAPSILKSFDWSLSTIFIFIDY